MTRTKHIGNTKFEIVKGRRLKIGDKRWDAGYTFEVPKTGRGVPIGGIDVDRLIRSGVIKEAGRG